VSAIFILSFLEIEGEKKRSENDLGKLKLIVSATWDIFLISRIKLFIYTVSYLSLILNRLPEKAILITF